ncbi:uncharacterized protein [Periplaneta americana]
MNINNMESEVDPLAVQSCDDAFKEEAEPLPDEGNYQHVTRIKAEYLENSYKHTSEIKYEEILLANNFPVVKFEAEEMNSLPMCSRQIKTEYEDNSYDLTSEMKCEETSVPVPFPKVKNETE